MKKVISVLFVALILSSCTTRISDFSVISTKSIDWSRANTFKRSGERVEGKNIVHFIMFIPTGDPTVQEAVDEALESVPGAVALVDAVVYEKFWWIPFIYGNYGYIVEGNTLIDPALTSLSIDGNVFRVSYYNEDSTIITKDVSEEEFNEIREMNSLN